MSKWKIWCLGKSIPAENGSCAWGGVLCNTEENKTVHYGFISEHGDTHLAELISATEMLRMIPEKAEVIFYATSEYLIKGLDSWVDGWMRRDWKTKNGSEVSHKNEWIALYHEFKHRKVRLKWERKNIEKENLIEFEKAEKLVLKQLHDGGWIPLDY